MMQYFNRPLWVLLVAFWCVDALAADTLELDTLDLNRDSIGVNRAPVSEDDSIYVIQERAFSKSGKYELNMFLTTKINPKFVGYAGLGLSAAWHIRENFGIEFTTTIPIPFIWTKFYSDFVHEIYEYEDLTPEEVDLKVMDYYGALSMQFSALYGKLRFYSFLLDYDLYITAGVGLAHTQRACTDLNASDCKIFHVGRGLQPQKEAWDRWKITGNIGGGLRFFFSDFMGLRFEVRDVVYSDRDIQNNTVTTDIRNNIMFSSGLSFLF